MGIFDWIEQKFSKKELETTKENSIRKCEYPNCENEGENTCRFCGKFFCALHSDPLNHSCGSKEDNNKLPEKPVRKLIKNSGEKEAPTLPTPEIPKDF